MKIAICDDERVCRAQVLDVATDYAEERQDCDIEFQMFTDSTQLLEAVKEGAVFDIYILDIVMPGLNGIQLGQALRDLGVESKIIYLTSSEEYALDSFKIRAFHYLLKPIKKAAFYEVMDEAVSSLSVKRDRSMIVKTKESNARITFDSIIYAELAKRAVVYHLTGGKNVESTTLRTTFAEAVRELAADKRFVMCGASTLANLHHISMVKNESLVFDDGDELFLNKKTCREIRTAWSNYWIAEE